MTDDNLVRIDVDRSGMALSASGSNTGDVRRALSSSGVRFRQRVSEGGLVFDPWEGLALNAAGFEWSASALRLTENRRRIAEAADTVNAEFQRITAGGATVARAAVADGALTGQLDDHQAINVALLTAPGTWGGCVFDEQGTGKTVTMIATFDVLVERGLTDTLLVVAPKSMVAEWRTEFGRFTGDLYRVVVAEGDRHAKSSALYSGADVVVVNFETLVALEAEVIQLARRTRLTIAVDESFNVKNPDATRTRAAARVREWCTHAFVLCGTPAPNSATDVVAQFNLVDLGRTFRGLSPDKDRAVAAQQVGQRLAEHGLYVRNVKSVALPDLPPKSFTEIEVELAPQQQAAYDAALRDLIIDLEHVDDATFARQIQSFLERRAALLRICADPTPVVPGYNETPAKVAALDQLLNRLVSDNGEKVVVWSFYRSSLDRIAERYAGLGLVRIDGSVADSAERRRAVRAFQEDPATRVFLGNPAAAGAGLTLHSARYAIYESLSNQAAHYLQSLDRIHRRGQNRDVRYVTLVSRGTIEEVEYRRLRQKADDQAALLGDPPTPALTRTLLLDELLGVRGCVQQSGVRVGPDQRYRRVVAE
jgi:SNF2 family DNA or RNA helicase